MDITCKKSNIAKIRIADFSKYIMGNPPASLEISFIENDLDTNGKLKVQIIYKKGTSKKTLPKIFKTLLYLLLAFQ